MFQITILVSFFLASIQTLLAFSNISTSNLNQSLGIIIRSESSQGQIGNTARSAGDFNDDGYDDLLISSYSAQGVRGAVYVIFGTKEGLSDLTLGSNQGLVITGANTLDQLGYSVNSGDVNGDKIDDIIIGAVGYQSGTGIVYVIYGSKTLPAVLNLAQGLATSQGFTVTGTNSQDRLGMSVSLAGDFNKDGVNDVIIGSQGFSGRKGAAYVIFGKTGTRGNLLAGSLSSAEGLMIKGAEAFDTLGSSVSNAGDFNGDGIEDVIIGASGVSLSVGAAYVIFGKDGRKEIFSTIDLSSGLSQSQGFRIHGSISENQFGYVVGSAGDFNGDGKSDVMIGNSGNSAIVYMIFGGDSLSNIDLNSALDPTRGIKIKGAKPSDVLGRSFSSVRDINQDGIGDVVIGAPGAQNYMGTAYVIFGRIGVKGDIDLGVGLGPTEGFAINGAGPSNTLGTAVSAGGDMNGDGVPDVVVGAAGAHSGLGAVYLLFSPPVCPENCKTCQKASVCLVCETGYGLDGAKCLRCAIDSEVINGVCVPKKSTLTTVTEVSKGLFDSGSTTSRVFTMGRSLSVGLGLMAKIIQNVRFLNISYPQEVESAFESYGTELFELPIPGTFCQNPDSKGLPSQYSRFDISPSFLENYWQTIMTILITLACFLVTKLIQYLTKGGTKQVILKNVGQTAANFLVIQIYSNLDDVIFYFLLDTSSTKLNSASSRFSLSMACFFLLLGLCLVFFHCWVLSKYQQAKREDNFESFQRKFRIVGTLYEDFKDDNAVKQSFFGVLILRCVFLVLIIMLLQPPWIQASLLMLTNLIFLGYFIYQRPFKNKFDEISQYFCELNVFAAYLSTLILSVLDYKEDYTTGVRDGLGKCIVIAGIALSLGGFIIQVIQIIGAIYSIYQFFKASSKKEKRIPISIVLKQGERVANKDKVLKNESMNVELSSILMKKGNEKIPTNSDLDISCLNSESVLILNKPSRVSHSELNTLKGIEPTIIQVYPSNHVPQSDLQESQVNLNLESEGPTQMEIPKRPQRFQRKKRIKDSSSSSNQL